MAPAGPAKSAVPGRDAFAPISWGVDAGKGSSGSSEKGPCRYYANGNCKRGANCDFSHDIVVDNKKGITTKKKKESKPKRRRSSSKENDNGNDLPQKAETTASTSTSATSVLLATDSIKGIAEQMQLINDTLEGLKAEVQGTMNREKMNATLAMLQKHANMVQQSLQRTIIPEKPAPSNSKSFSEVLKVKRSGNHKPVKTSADTKANDAQTSNTLDDLIMSCAPYLTGSPKDYIAWLREELDVNTVADLSEAIVECPDLILGAVDAGHKRKFYDVVLEGRADELHLLLGGAEASSKDLVPTTGMNSKPRPTIDEDNGTGAEEKRDLDDEAAPTSTNRALESMKNAVAWYIAGSPTPKDYITSLRRELNVETLTLDDLVEVMEECLDVLTSMKDDSASDEDVQLYNAVLGGFTTGSQEDFVKTFLSAARTLSKLTGPAAEEEKSSDTTVQAAAGGQREADDGGWTCTVCTCVNPKLFLMCSACGSTGGDATAEEMVASATAAASEGQSIAATSESAVITPPSSAEKKRNASPTSTSSFEGVASASSSDQEPESPTESAPSTSLNPSASAYVPILPPFDMDAATPDVESKPKQPKLLALNPSAQTFTPASLCVTPAPSTDTKTMVKGSPDKQLQMNETTQSEEKKKRKKARTKKDAELARQAEEERAAAEADRQRRMEAKLEKQAAMARHEAEVQRQQQKLQSGNAALSTMVSSSPAKSAVVTRNASSPSTARKKKTVVVDRLSFYIKPSSTGGKEVSPIFALLQNDSTVEDGRKLMVMEVEAQRCKDELVELVALKPRLEDGIKREEKSITKSRATIDEQERKHGRLSSLDDEAIHKKLAEIEKDFNKANKNNAQLKNKGKKCDQYRELRKAWEVVEKMTEIIQDAKVSYRSQVETLQNIRLVMPAKTEELEKLRSDIAEIKGGGMEEDSNFHIDGSRDDRGFTILMVAAQNDDFFTAKTCFDLGADAFVTSPEGLTAIDFSYFLGFEHVTELIVQNGGSLPQKQCGAWSSLQSMAPQSKETSKNWDDTLMIAETAALPAETLMEAPEICEGDEKKRMPLISPHESLSSDFTCFESRLVDQNINPDQVQRVVLLDKAVYNWSLSADTTTRSNFVNVMEGLKPPAVRRPGVQETKIHRRAIIGAATTYEVLAARFEESSKIEKVVLFTPFVSGDVEGVVSIGVLVWAVVPDSEASLYKTLVANTEFMRHKVKLDDRFLAHKESVLELGKDMHLLDLHSTSIWTTSTMDMYVLNVDNGDLDRIVHDSAFSAKKRIVHSEQQVNEAIFRTVQEEVKEDEGTLATERIDMSTLVSGGAGTGKTLLMIKKVSREERSRHVLVVSRLPRLVNMIKTNVEEIRGDDTANLTFTTYDDLLQLLARRVVPDDDSQHKSFVQFDRIRFDCDDSNISFSQEFVAGFLNSKERKQMANNMIEPLTLWHAITTIKSHAKCASTKSPLLLDDYTSLPPSFGLTEDQRQLCYSLFVKYEAWREFKHYWDEMDRVLYVLKFGPSVFRDDHFIPWTDRVNQFGEMDLLNKEGEPLYPFFYDIVCADEAQDFTEINLILFAKMSASISSLFLSADPAQSVELGVKMRAGTVNDAVHSLIKGGKLQVKDVLQYINLQTNHRTHAQNLAMGKAIRRILARSFKVPIIDEVALINGNLPKTLTISKVSDLADTSTFRGGNIVFLAPDEKVHELRLQFNQLELENDIFGVREAKGLEFDACALVGFFEFMEERGSSDEWQNVLRWLSSSSSITKTESTGEKVSGVLLADCDYRLSAPNVSNEAMMLYTALTRARNHLYLIEVENFGKGKKQKGVRLSDFAFRRFEDLGLAKSVTFIDEGHVEMTAAQHKARGVLYVTQALTMSRNRDPIGSVKDKLTEAKKRFGPDQGNDDDLLDKCEKHLSAVLQKHTLMQFAKEKFLVGGEYNLEGRFAEVLQFELNASKFFSEFLCDSFLFEEVHDVRCLVEEVVEGTPYEDHFKDVCAAIRMLEEAV